MLSARDHLEIEKPRGKLICKVVISGERSNGTARYCNAELADNKNTSAMNGYLEARHKNIKFKKELMDLKILIHQVPLKHLYSI
jgi:hypothetical protein